MGEIICLTDPACAIVLGTVVTAIAVVNLVKILHRTHPGETTTGRQSKCRLLELDQSTKPAQCLYICDNGTYTSRKADRGFMCAEYIFINY